MELGEKIKMIREKSGMSQEKLARQVGVGLKTVEKWESGRDEPDREILKRIAAALKTPLHELTGEEVPDKRKDPYAILPLMVNLSMLGYVLVTIGVSGFYRYYLSKPDAVLWYWILIFAAGIACIAYRAYRYHLAHGSWLFQWDIPFLAGAVAIPLIPLPGGSSVFVMMGCAIVFILAFLQVVFHPWEKR